MNNFTVYTKVGCTHCVRVQQVLQLAELKHVIYQLDRDFDKDSFYSQFGEGATFPQVVMNGTDLGGCVETIKYIQENLCVV
tara:strand:- start:1354 stop:1596 length:243 start_codon:yes stop_codon:yes gene_type:complete